MKKIKNVLLVIDGHDDRQAFIAEAATVAKDAGAEVTLLSDVVNSFVTPH